MEKEKHKQHKQNGARERTKRHHENGGEGGGHKSLGQRVRHASPAQKAGLLVGGSLVAAALTAYFFAGKGGRDRRTNMKDWAHDARNEVADKLESVRAVSTETYKKVVDSVANEYASRGVDRYEVASWRDRLNGFWDENADLIEEAKRTGQDFMVMVAKKLRDTDSTKDAAREIRESIKQSAREGIRAGAQRMREDGVE